MELTPEIKEKIKHESSSYLEAIGVKSQYGKLSKKDRDVLGAFYTPPELVIQMLEMFNCTLEEFAEEDILDPTCGSGNLIMGAMIAGLEKNSKFPEHIFGNEFAESPLEVCRKRFTHFCKTNGHPEYDAKFWEIHLHQGDALRKDCIEKESFHEGYKFLDEKISKGSYDKLSKIIQKQYKQELNKKGSDPTGFYVLKKETKRGTNFLNKGSRKK